MLKDISFRYGFGVAYVNQGVGDVDKFMSEFTQRVEDNFSQEWHNDIQSLPKLDHYHKYKSIFEIEKYLLILDIRKYRVALSKFRCVNHKLNVEIGRQCNTPRHLRFCVYCLKQKLKCVEDEYHLISVCSLYTDIRNKYVAFASNCSYSVFLQIMSSESENLIQSLACYIYHCFKMRDSSLQEG